MKYMLLIYGAEDCWTEEERKDCMRKSMAICDELEKEGKWIASSPLRSVTTATSVRVRDGKRQITDGPFAETTEQLGGYYIIDVDNLEQIHEMSFKVPGVNQDRVQPVDIELTSDGKYAFVALGPSNHVAVVDAQTYEVLDYLLVGSRVWQLDLDKDEKHLYTTNGVSGDVSVIDVEDLKVIKSIKVGRYPWGVVIDPSS